ncbi:hypothetical protein EFK50_21070 [Nocardioides marmoriginsengisoli]|uniref:Uncharacterized protein n=1 Tax=Nocardioides marmoriginsengisoli TaxID=661483 RepID=A0A3N0CCL1_9ACTN|nr:hypothetical protein EFK50_21070 [Nocardioides marmoriginsengisoli]
MLRLAVLAGLGFAASKALRGSAGTTPAATPAPVPTPTPAPAPKAEVAPPPAVEIPTSPVEPDPVPEPTAEASAPAEPDAESIARLEDEAPLADVPAPEVPADSLTSFFDDVLTENEEAKRQG